MSALNAFLARGALSHNIDQRFTLFEIARAHDAVEQHRATGHVALAVP